MQWLKEEYLTVYCQARLRVLSKQQWLLILDKFINLRNYLKDFWFILTSFAHTCCKTERESSPIFSLDLIFEECDT